MRLGGKGTAKVVVIISTVLPGTVRSRILPLLNPLVKLCYNPYFIAMGTVIPDFLNPEFILFGYMIRNRGGYLRSGFIDDYPASLL
jgi:UDPglucose 6-dehydrogenase